MVIKCVILGTIKYVFTTYMRHLSATRPRFHPSFFNHYDLLVDPLATIINPVSRFLSPAATAAACLSAWETHPFFNMHNPAAQARLTRACTSCRERKVKCMHPPASSREPSSNELKAVEVHPARIASSRKAPVSTQPRVGAGQEAFRAVEALKTRLQSRRRKHGLMTESCLGLRETQMQPLSFTGIHRWLC